MDRLVATNSVVLAGADTPPATGTPQYATSGNPATATPATVLPAYAFNAIQEELIAIIVGGGITPSRFVSGQVFAAIQAMSKQSLILADTGAANAYTAANATPLTLATLVHGVRQTVQFSHANTGSSTYAPDGLPVKPIYGRALASLQGGEITANGIGNMIYIVNATLNGGNGAWVIFECTGGALQISAGSQSAHAAQVVQVQSSLFTSAVSGGTSDVITASFTPAITALVNGMSLSIRPAAANATTTPTFTPNSGVIPSYVVVKGANQPLAPNDFAGGGHWADLQWDATLSKWILLNPATGVATVTATSDPTFVSNAGSPSSTSWVQGLVSSITALFAPKASPALTGIPTAPTPSTGTNSTQIATTAYVQNQGYATPANLAAYAPLASPALTGTPTSATAPGASDNSTKIPNTSWIWTNIQALVTNCIAAVATAAGFSYSISTSWYVKFPTWLGAWVIQGGVFTTSAAGYTSWTFPVSFPTAPRIVVGSVSASTYPGGASFAANMASATTSSVPVVYGGASAYYADPVCIIAFGN